MVRELSRAQGKIATLEEFIRDRERQFHSAVVRMERRDSFQGTGIGTRVRRAGLSHDMLRLRSMSSEEHEDISGMKIKISPFSACLQRFNLNSVHCTGVLNIKDKIMFIYFRWGIWQPTG